MPIRRHCRTANRISTTPRANLTAMAAVEGAVFGAGGLPPVARTTVAITTTRQASQPRMKARPFLVPFSVLSSRMKAVSGNGSRGDAEADEEKVSYHHRTPGIKAVSGCQQEGQLI